MQISWENNKFDLIFDYLGLERGKAFLIRGPASKPIPSNLLLWLSAYIGEDTIDPLGNKDTRLNHERGMFEIESKSITKFLSAIKRMEDRKWPKWRLDLARDALIYYSVAVRSGVNLMPLNMGFFGLSLECLGNVRYGKETSTSH